jgi:hypothetical protein
LTGTVSASSKEPRWRQPLTGQLLRKIFLRDKKSVAHLPLRSPQPIDREAAQPGSERLPDHFARIPV